MEGTEEPIVPVLMGPLAEVLCGTCWAWTDGVNTGRLIVIEADGVLWMARPNDTDNTAPNGRYPSGTWKVIDEDTIEEAGCLARAMTPDHGVLTFDAERRTASYAYASPVSSSLIRLHQPAPPPLKEEGGSTC